MILTITKTGKLGRSKVFARNGRTLYILRKCIDIVFKMKKRRINL